MSMCLCLSPRAFCLAGATLEAGFGGTKALPGSCQAAEDLHSQFGGQAAEMDRTEQLGKLQLLSLPCSSPSGAGCGSGCRRPPAAEQ